MSLNNGQIRRVISIFQAVDDLLTEAASRLLPPEDGRLFERYVADATPVQRQVCGEQLRRLRQLLRRFIEERGMARSDAATSGVWAFRTALDFVRVALADLRPKVLIGYGALDDEDAVAIERLLADAYGILGELGDFLARGLGGDIAARLARLDQTRGEVALLRELEAIITRQGLVELRATLAMLLERVERDWLEVGFFGRVSCGKSSLINTLIGSAVLPAGTTPVTAVPTRVVPGAVAAVRVSFAVGDPIRIAPGRLAEFASEEGNPANRRHVTEIVVESPSPRLSTGVCLVDTPGLGSLATEGAAETLGYLPRCDVGVLLIDASGSLGADDVAIARALLEAGARLLPVVSKADLLGRADLDKVLKYVRRHLAAALAVDIAVAPVSVVAEGGRLADDWFRRELEPLLKARRQVAQVSTRRKIGALHEAVMVALQARLRAPGESSTSLTRRGATQQKLSEARALLDRAGRRIDGLLTDLRQLTAELLGNAASHLASVWVEAQGDGRSAVALTIARELDQRGAAIEAVLRQTRDALGEALQAASTSIPADEADDGLLPVVAARPLFDPAPVVADAEFDDTPLVWLGARVRSVLAHRRVRRALATPLSEALHRHAQVLRRWAMAQLDEQRRAFEAATATFSTLARLESETRSERDRATGADSLAADLERLRRWNAGGTRTEKLP